MSLKKDILDHKKNSKRTVTPEYLEQQKGEIWKIIQKEHKKTPIISISKAAVFIAIAAGFALLIIIWNNEPATIEVNSQVQSNEISKDTVKDSKADELVTHIEIEKTEDYLAENTSIEELESEYVAQIEKQDTATLHYETYLISEGVDENLIIDELL